jgi:hypothetical protein
LLGYDYEKVDMDVDHFHRMREHKYKLLKENGIEVFIDDNPYYVSYMKDMGIDTFQMILPHAYTESFGKKDPYFTCHLQEKQFEFISSLSRGELNKK